MLETHMFQARGQESILQQVAAELTVKFKKAEREKGLRCFLTGRTARAHPKRERSTRYGWCELQLRLYYYQSVKEGEETEKSRDQR